MKVALYIGSHRGDKWHIRFISYLIRLAQKGNLGNVTHVEAILAEHDDGTVTIASSSKRDGGVRSKRVKLDPNNWIIVDVPQWSLDSSIEWFEKHYGDKYDWRGAAATVLPGKGKQNQWFCNEAVGASVGLVEPDTFGPHQFAAIAISLSKNWK